MQGLYRPYVSLWETLSVPRVLEMELLSTKEGTWILRGQGRHAWTAVGLPPRYPQLDPPSPDNQLALMVAKRPR